MPDGCKGLRGVDVLNEYYGLFSQAVVNRRHGLFSEWICSFVSLQRCKREREYWSTFFLLLSLKSKSISVMTMLDGCMKGAERCRYTKGIICVYSSR